MAAKASAEVIETERGIDEVTHVPNVTQVSVALANGNDELSAILRALEAARLKVSLVKIHSGALNFVAEGNLEPARAERIVSRPAKVRQHCAIIMLRTPAMRMLHGIMATAVEALYARDIQVHATSDAYDCLSLVIDGAKTRAALSTLKKRFGVS